MTLQQIAYIKSNFKGLRIRKELTSMFTNKDWAALFEINILTSTELINLVDYCKEQHILCFIGRAGINVQ